MTTMTVQLRSVEDTGAAIGWAGGHSIMVDRPSGKAGGQGLGFNGGELLGLAIGGCFCNDLQYTAHAMGIRIATLAVDVTVAFTGVPLLATGATLRVRVTADDPQADVAELVRRARADSTVSNSIARGVPVTMEER
jgi:organic hydroperoxide reductase OsmC/OhrA